MQISVLPRHAFNFCRRDFPSVCAQCLTLLGKPDVAVRNETHASQDCPQSNSNSDFPLWTELGGKDKHVQGVEYPLP